MKQNTRRVLSEDIFNKSNFLTNFLNSCWWSFNMLFFISRKLTQKLNRHCVFSSDFLDEEEGEHDARELGQRGPQQVAVVRHPQGCALRRAGWVNLEKKEVQLRTMLHEGVTEQRGSEVRRRKGTIFSQGCILDRSYHRQKLERLSLDRVLSG